MAWRILKMSSHKVSAWQQLCVSKKRETVRTKVRGRWENRRMTKYFELQTSSWTRDQRTNHRRPFPVLLLRRLSRTPM